MRKCAGISPRSCGILWCVAYPARNEIRLGGFVPVIFRPQECTRMVISEYASLVRKSYSGASLRSVPSYCNENLPELKQPDAQELG